MLNISLLLSSLLLATLGLPGNSMILYVAITNLKKVATAELFILHLSIGNMMQLIARILTIIIPDHGGVCYPLTIPCKTALFVFCVGRRVSMLFTLFLGMFRLMKLIRRGNRILGNIILENTHMNLPLILIWMFLLSICVPYILIPDNRPSHHNVTNSCTCSFFDALTDNDASFKVFDIIFGTGSLVLAVISMWFLSISILWILRKHQLTIDVNLNKSRRSQHEIKAIKGITTLMACYIICNVVHTLFRNFSGCLSFDVQRIAGDIYAAVSPFILGLGYPRFRKYLLCMRLGRICQKPKEQETVTIA
ncbi:uncharacterized protein RCH25_053128 [Pelodytes ibericus]